MNTYTAPHARQTSTDVRPYSEGQARLIKTMCEERDITPAQLMAVFPSRPTTFAEASKVIAWIKGQTKPSQPSSPQAGKTYTVPKLPTGKRGYGYYAIPAGELGYAKPHFFRVKTAKGSGFQYLDEKASDDLYPVRGARRAQIMEYLAANNEAAGALYGELIGNCRFCHKDLTDTNNPYKSRGAGPDCGPKYLG
jgi:hypothetical protein